MRKQFWLKQKQEIDHKLTCVTQELNFMAYFEYKKGNITEIQFKHKIHDNVKNSPCCKTKEDILKYL